MSVQVIQDEKGNNAGVFIPYNEWNRLKNQYKELQALEGREELAKDQVINNIKKGLKEVQQFKKGKLKTTLAKDFLNEL